MRRFSTALGVGVVAALTGCGLTPPNRPMQFAAASEQRDEAPPAANLSDCRLYVNKIEDARDARDRFGSLPNFELFENSVPRWVRDAVATLDSMGHTVVFAESRTERQSSDILLNLKIHKAYVHLAAQAKSANLALAAEYVIADKPPQQKLYRGKNTSINWASRPGEMESAMNRAMQDVLISMSADLQRLCRE